MGVSVDLASDVDSGGGSRRKVAEFSLLLSEMQETNALKSAWDQLVDVCPPNFGTERLRLTLQSTLTELRQRIGQDLVLTVTFIITCLSPAVCFPSAEIDDRAHRSVVAQAASTTSPVLRENTSWGFFVIDRPTSAPHTSYPSEHIIEICLYCE